MIENHSPPHTLDEVIRWLTQQTRRVQSSSHDSGSERCHRNEATGSQTRAARLAAARQVIIN